MRGKALAVIAVGAMVLSGCSLSTTAHGGTPTPTASSSTNAHKGPELPHSIDPAIVSGDGDIALTMGSIVDERIRVHA